MNMTRESGLKLVTDISNGIAASPSENVKVIIAPPYPFISMVGDLIQANQTIYLAAQNCHHEDGGAYTGEVSGTALKSCDCEYCIVGHSERRAYFGEDDELINKKVRQLLKNEIKPIYCCGETLKERENGKHFEVVGNQVSEAILGLSKEEIRQVVVAYEPVWAIGTGITATPEQAQEMHAFIREKLASVFNEESENVPILYGGSVKPSNAKELFGQADIDGGLIGGASLNADDFLQLISSF